MTKEERISYWRGLMDQQATSGLSAATFCLQHDIRLQQFYRWRRRFRNQTSTSSPSAGFLELVALPEHPKSGVRIIIGNALQVEVERGFDPFTLRTVVDALCSGRKKPCLA